MSTPVLPLFEPSGYMKTHAVTDKFLESQIAAQQHMIDHRKQEIERLKKEIENLEMVSNSIRAYVNQRSPTT